MSCPTKNQKARRKAKFRKYSNEPEWCGYCGNWFIRKKMAAEVEGGGAERIYMDREDLTKLRDALNKFLEHKPKVSDV